MVQEYIDLLEKSKERSEFIARQLKYLGRFNIKNFDHIVASFHDEVFERIDCLQCGNCCRSIGPKMNEPDIRRACKAYGLDQKSFVPEALHRDDELGWMFNKLPCMFLQEDNSCAIYDERPKDCDSFPYTRDRNIQKSLGRLAFNAGICPAAYLIAMKIIERFAPGPKQG